MGSVIYTLGLRLFEFLTEIVSFFNTKARAFVDGRRTSLSLLSKQLTHENSALVWFHCSSVGEYEQGRPLMELFKTQYPQYKILVTFYSPSGYDAVKPDQIINYTAYLPMDSKRNAKNLIDIVQPKVAFFIKYEFWHFYLSELKKRNIPVFSVSSIFRKDQIYFKWYGGFYRKILKNISYFFVQDQASSDRLKNLGIGSMVTGDTRIDRVVAIKENGQPIKKIDSFLDEKETMIVGSLRKEDLEIITEFVGNHPELKFIIAPHEITESMMEPLEKELSAVRYSMLTDAKDPYHVLIIDNIGMLSRLYQYANYSYVGGGFSDGLHNILEPAVYQIPIFFGNKDYQRFKEAIDLIDLGAAFPIGSITEFETVFDHLATDTSQQDSIRESLSGYLTDNKGGAEKIMKYLEGTIA